MSPARGSSFVALWVTLAYRDASSEGPREEKRWSVHPLGTVA